LYKIRLLSQSVHQTASRLVQPFLQGSPVCFPGVRYLTGLSAVFWHKVRLTISLRTGQVKVRYFIRYSSPGHFSTPTEHHLATFTKGEFSSTNALKSRGGSEPKYLEAWPPPPFPLPFPSSSFFFSVPFLFPPSSSSSFPPPSP